MPDGVLNAVAGNTHEISDAIMASHEVRKISFTGSTSVGKTLVRNAADTMKKVSMELGNAPYIVFEDADIDAAVKGAIANKFRNAGQVCVSVNRFYIQETVYDKFVNKLADAVNALKVGNGLEDGVVVGPLIEPSAPTNSVMPDRSAGQVSRVNRFYIQENPRQVSEQLGRCGERAEGGKWSGRRCGRRPAD